MESLTLTLIALAVGACFLIYLFFTRQFKWLFNVLRNAALGVIGLLAGNFLLAPMGLAVGINILTVFIVGLLGIPGLILLFVTGWML